MPDPDDFSAFHRVEPVTIHARAIIDARGTAFSPGQIAINIHSNPGNPSFTLQTAGVSAPTASDPTIDLPDSLLVPAFVNAHCHLDLTNIGPRPKPQSGGFPAWLKIIRDNRPQTPETIRGAVRHGIELSKAGGVGAVGDIAGALRTGPTLVPWQTLRDSPMLGLSFLEFFAIGTMQDAALDTLSSTLETLPHEHPMLGLEPHAPYSVSRQAYEQAIDLAQRFNLPLATHLAETIEERQFTTTASGPQRDFLESLNIWDESLTQHLTSHPVDYLAPLLGAHPWLLAHVNDCPDHALDLLATTRCSVAYCPRAHEYFDIASTLGPHRYRDMLAQSINVCLGTDSIVNLEPEHDNTVSRISPLDDARLLFNRDRADPQTLLAMLTINGARALKLDHRAFTFTPGAPLAGVVRFDHDTLADDPLKALFETTAPPSLLTARELINLI